MRTLQQDIDFQKSYYSVIVDGNKHNIKRVVTKREPITVKKCQEIVAKIKDVYPDIDIKKIKIDMTEWDYSGFTEESYQYVLSGDVGVPQTVDKEAYYYPKTNTLQIWERGYPVYENADGVITTDEVALADCLL